MYIWHVEFGGLRVKVFVDDSSDGASGPGLSSMSAERIMLKHAVEFA